MRGKYLDRVASKVLEPAEHPAGQLSGEGMGGRINEQQLRRPPTLRHDDDRNAPFPVVERKSIVLRSCDDQSALDSHNPPQV
ncbi:hypothetical protein Trydic_g17779 [Trypoxylus dichotomus]